MAESVLTWQPPAPPSPSPSPSSSSSSPLPPSLPYATTQQQSLLLPPPPPPTFNEEVIHALDAVDAVDTFAADTLDSEIVATGAVQSQNRDLVNGLVAFLTGTIAFKFQQFMDNSEHQLGIVLAFLFAVQLCGRLDSFLKLLLSRPSFGRPALAEYVTFSTRHATMFVGFVVMAVLRSNIMPADGGFRLIDVLPVTIMLLLILAEIMLQQFHLNNAQALYRQLGAVLTSSKEQSKK